MRFTATGCSVATTEIWPFAGLGLAAACWALAFALFAWRYGPMLCSARVDGHPG